MTNLDIRRGWVLSAKSLAIVGEGVAIFDYSCRDFVTSLYNSIIASLFVSSVLELKKDNPDQYGLLKWASVHSSWGLCCLGYIFLRLYINGVGDNLRWVNILRIRSGHNQQFIWSDKTFLH